MPVTLPNDLKRWAEAEVAAGRAGSLEALTARALAEHRRRTEALRESLDAAVAEADRDGWVEGEDLLSEMDDLIAALERETAASA